MDLGLKGKVALITGGSEGIGRATARRLVQEGSHVAFCARRPDVLRGAADEIRSAATHDARVLEVQADVTQPAQVEQFVEQAAREFGRIDILYNNAGTSAAHPFESVDDDYWQRDLDVKVFGAIRCCRLVIPHMRRQGGGAIVNLTHVGAKQPGARSLPTTLSRAAGIALTKALSKEFAPENIRVNTICVSLIRSAQHERRWGQQREKYPDIEQFYTELGRNIPVGRVGYAEEVADLVAFLVSERAAFITGASVNIDGGVSGVV